MFAPTTAMLTAQGQATPQWVFGASAGYDDMFDANWGGCNIWISLDDVSYQLIGTLSGPSTIGALSQPLPGYGGINPDTADTLYVNLAECGKALPSVSSALAQSGYSLCILQDVSGFELLSYTTATLVSADTYALTGLYRGLYGTTPRAFGAGSSFLAVGTAANVFETALPQAYVGMTVWVKAQSFNVFHSATQELSSCVAYPYFVTSPTPAPPVPPPMQAATYRRLRQQTKETSIKRGRKQNGKF
jgi:hypothetical protein